MAREERFGHRDLTFSGWHRSLSKDFTFIDVDFLAYCHKCRAPLALMELAQDVGQSHKPTLVLRRLAERAGVPSFLLFYKPANGTVESFRLRQLTPVYGVERALTRGGYSAWEKGFRDAHSCREELPA